MGVKTRAARGGGGKESQRMINRGDGKDKEGEDGRWMGGRRSLLIARHVEAAAHREAGGLRTTKKANRREV